MPNTKNIQKVQDLKEKLAKAKSIVFTEYKGLDANQMNQLKAKIKETDAEINIAKNTLLDIALKEEKITEGTGVTEQLEGQNATILAYNDPIAPIKALYEFIKETKLPLVKNAIIEGKVITAAEVETLSKLPNKEQLLAQVVRSLKSPITGIVNVLGGSQRKLVYALSAIAEKKTT